MLTASVTPQRQKIPPNLSLPPLPFSLVLTLAPQQLLRSAVIDPVPSRIFEGSESDGIESSAPGTIEGSSHYRALEQSGLPV